MANLTPLGRSKIAKAIYQGAALPGTRYFALGKVNKGVFVAGATYAVGDCVIPTAWAGRLYKATAITTGVAGAEPAWPVAAGGQIVSGGVTFTEQTTALLAGTFAEADFAGYARGSLACTAANFSEDASGNVANLAAIVFGASPGASQMVAVVLEMDAAAAGNVLSVEAMTNPQTANVGASAVTTAIGAFTFSQT